MLSTALIDVYSSVRDFEATHRAFESKHITFAAGPWSCALRVPALAVFRRVLTPNAGICLLMDLVDRSLTRTIVPHVGPFTSNVFHWGLLD